MACKTETWKAIVGAEGRYEVSDQGRIRRVLAGKATRVGRILKLHVRPKDNRVAITLRVNGANKSNSVHRLVAESFIGPCPPGKEVNHLDGDPANNKVENLEYVSRRENMQHAFKLGLVSVAQGEEHHFAQLTTEQAIIIRHCSAPVRMMARVFGVSRSTISNVKKCRTWKHIRP